MKITTIEDNKEYQIKEITNGTEKQQNFANDVKLELMSKLVAYPNCKTLNFETYFKEMNDVIDYKFWLDNRSSSTKTILQQLIKK